MGDASALHFEPLERPVSGGDGADEAGGEDVAVEEEGVVCVEFGGAGGLFEDFVDRGFEVGVVGFEEVFEEEGEELAGTMRGVSMYVRCSVGRKGTDSSRRLLPT